MSYQQQMPPPEGYREQTNMTRGYPESGYRANMQKISPQEQNGRPSPGQRLALAIISLFFLLIAFLVVVQIAYISSHSIINSTIVGAPPYLLPLLFIFFLLFFVAIIIVNILFLFGKKTR